MRAAGWNALSRARSGARVVPSRGGSRRPAGCVEKDLGTRERGNRDRRDVSERVGRPLGERICDLDKGLPPIVRVAFRRAPHRRSDRVDGQDRAAPIDERTAQIRTPEIEREDVLHRPARSAIAPRPA
jgi:hypothetical protein